MYNVLRCIITIFYIIYQSIALLQADSRLTIEISQGSDKATTIAVVPFNWNGDIILPEDISDIVGNDLKLTGYFDVLSRDTMLNMPNKSEEVVYKNWQVLGVSYLLIGSIKKEKEQYVAYYELLDVVKKYSILSGKVTGNSEQMRNIAHKISDEVFETITSVKGDFLSKILYVVYKKDVSEPDPYNYHLNYADADGHRVRTVFKSNRPILSPTWSPDGKTIAYISFELGRSMIYLQDLYSGHRKKLIFYKGVNSSPVFSPDGSMLAFSSSKNGYANIYIKSLITGNLSQITNKSSINTEPEWMPDGKSIIFTSNRGGSPQIYQVYLKFLSNGLIQPIKSKRITYEGKFNARAKVFPNGKSIALVHKTENQNMFNIAILNLENNKLVKLTSSALEDSPSISPNGHRFIYAIQSTKLGQLSIVSISNRSRLMLPHNRGNVREPAWSKYYDLQ